MPNAAPPSAEHASARRVAVRGLSEAEVLRRRAEVGENLLPEPRGPRALAVLLGQLRSPLVYVVLAAALISLLVGERADFAIIMVVVLIDALVGFAQEYQAGRTYAALRGLLKPVATVIRDGERREIALRELVPGDVAVLAAGDRVPGDGRVLQGERLSVDEAILTGESEAVSKRAAEGADRVFMGTTVLTGRGLVEIVGTGRRTELGAIASSLGEEEQPSPLQLRLRRFSRTLSLLIVAVTAAILLVGLLYGAPLLEMLRVSIILAIAAIPEGLLIAVTVILVVGMRKILKREGLVKRLLAVETLGSVTVICTDKTGTLTEGRMRVTREALARPERAQEVMLLCNDLEGPVEAALWEHAALRAEGGAQAMVDRAERLGVEPFSSETRCMVSSDRLDGEERDHLKGAPEVVLGMCALQEEERARLLAQVDAWAGEGLRLIGLASRPRAPLEQRDGFEWAGLIGLEDPIREGVRESVAVARKAGVRVKMITGDYRRTAEHIARATGIATEGAGTLDGGELAALDDEALAERASGAVVFSRIRPQDKLRLVAALQARGEVAAMIGDGVNDAPALRRADIGVVMGSATDLARSTADLVLLDDNFRTVVAAVEEGRVIFQNIRKVVAYTLSNSFAEVLTVFVAMLLGWPAPLAVAQILWIHLICDGPSDIVLGFEPKEEGIMEEPPRPLREPILDGLGLALIGLISVTSAAVALTIFGRLGGPQGDLVGGQSFVFASFAVNSQVYIFAYRSMRLPLHRTGSLARNRLLVLTVLGGLALAALPFALRPLGELLGVRPLPPAQWGLVFGFALGLLLVVELGKLVARRVRAARPLAGPSRAGGPG